MGGGLCRPSDIFAASLSDAIATATPIHRTVLAAALTSHTHDPWLLADVHALLDPAYAASTTERATQRRQRTHARALWSHYHHAHTTALSAAQLAAAVHDALAATAAQVPRVVGAVLGDARRQMLQLGAAGTRDERGQLDARITQAEADANGLLAAWLQGLVAREAEVVHEVWVRLAERGKGVGGVTEAVFVAGWQAVCDEVLQLEQFRLRVPELLDDGDLVGEAEERKVRDARGESMDDSERREQSRTVVEVITAEESSKMRHGSMSDLHVNDEPPVE